MKVGKTKKECTVCLEGFEKGSVIRVVPKCKHVFHEGCIIPWFEKIPKCPNCRFNVKEFLESN